MLKLDGFYLLGKVLDSFGSGKVKCIDPFHFNFFINWSIANAKNLITF